MNAVIFHKTYAPPPFCEKEILRYTGCREADSEIATLLRTCIDEAKEQLTYQVCYRRLPVTVNADLCDFGAFQLRSKHLAFHLRGCEAVILFAATVGVGIDRLLAKYGRISPTKALMLQAIGAERIEALCDRFCADLAQEYPAGIRPRFSPGYGDLPLEAQKDIFALLDCGRQIGLTLNDSMLMSPSKSVTALVGIGSGGSPVKNTCSACKKKDCTFRGDL